MVGQNQNHKNLYAYNNNNNNKVNNKSKHNKKPIPEIINKQICEMHCSSQVGFSGEGGPKKINQDIYFIFDNFNNNSDSKYIGVWYENIYYIVLFRLILNLIKF